MIWSVVDNSEIVLKKSVVRNGKQPMKTEEEKLI